MFVFMCLSIVIISRPKLDCLKCSGDGLTDLVGVYNNETMFSIEKL